MAPLKILITGGAGFIGSRLASRLNADGHSVVVLDNLHPQVHGREGERALAAVSFAQVYRADVRDAEAVAGALDGVDVVYHLAAETGVGQSQYQIADYVSANTLGTAVVLEQAVARGVKQVVLSSSRAVYGEGEHHCSACDHVFPAASRKVEDLDAGHWEIRCPRCGGDAAHRPMVESTTLAPTSIYGVTKLQQEELVRTVGTTYGIPVTILRFFNVYGPGQSMRNPYVGVLGVFYRRAEAGETLDVYEDGRMLRDFVFVDDVVEALRRSAGDPRAYGRTLNVGTGQAVSLLQLAEETCRALGREPSVQISGRYRVGDVRHAVADGAEIQSALGFSPAVSFADGLRAYVAWARDVEGGAADTGVADAAAAEQLACRNLLRRAVQ